MKRELSVPHQHTTSPTKDLQLQPQQFGLTEDDVRRLASRLGVSNLCALPETLAYVAHRKLHRCEDVPKSSLVEIWDSIDESMKQRDKKNKEARLLIVGANPRNPDICTAATQELPNTTKALCAFIHQLVPHAQFNVVSIRANADKGPHRDLNNGPEDSFIFVIEEPKEGGNLWIAASGGSYNMRIHGSVVPGNILNCTANPLTFPSKSKLHATEPWIGDRRITLVAWCTLHLDRTLCSRLQEDYGFPSLTRLRPAAPQLSLTQSLLQHQAYNNKLKSLGQGAVFEVASSSGNSNEESQNQSSQQSLESTVPDSPSNWTPAPLSSRE